MILTVDVPRALWMTSNRIPRDRAHKARIVRAIHALTRQAITTQKIEPRPTPVEVSWMIGYPRGVPIADPANTHPTTKPILDALVTAGIIDGDDSRHVHVESFRRGPDIERGTGMHRVVLTIEPMMWAESAMYPTPELHEQEDDDA